MEDPFTGKALLSSSRVTVKFTLNMQNYCIILSYMYFQH
jgi:hypothetical protein